MSTCSFDPHDPFYKSPFGAVGCFTPVDFAFRPESGAVTGCTLLAYHEFADRRTELTLLRSEEDGVFRGTFPAPPQPELVWYHFRLSWADGGTSFYGRAVAASWDTVTPWQLTVYDDRAKTPEWFGRGITYQIFPDRFFRSEKRAVSGLVGHRVLHDRWEEAPLTGANEHGEYCYDFFGGDLRGIEQKLDYLASLHVTTLYLNPIFESSTNHRYDTADYETVDPLLGNEADLRSLCAAAKARGMRVMLDGVFNHTGAKSRYFNADGFYPDLGAAQSPDSPYAAWYHFSRFPDEYDAWWGIKNLPAVNELEKSYVNYIADGENSIVRRWLRVGASAWRLDVADELPDEFIGHLRAAAESEGAYLLGEVWEDGSNKIAYSKRRRYLLGSELHGLMNYPFRTALLDYLRGGDAAAFRETMETLRENYPAPAFYGSMNFLSTHDTPRILSALGSETPDVQSGGARLSPQERQRGAELLRLAAAILFCFPGSPSVYYGDEAGAEGFAEPFNLETYPWGREDSAMLDIYRTLGAIRAQSEALCGGTIEYLRAEGALLVFRRCSEYDTALLAVNAGDAPCTLTLPWDADLAVDALTRQRFAAENGALTVSLPARDCLLLTE